MHWTAGRSNGMTRRPDGWQGTKFFDLQTIHAESSGNTSE
jgi:hypothetical protein